MPVCKTIFCNLVNACGGAIPFLVPAFIISFSYAGGSGKTFVDVRTAVDLFAPHAQEFEREILILKGDFHFTNSFE